MSDLTGKRIPKQTLHGSISTGGSANPLRGNVMTRGLDGYSPTVEFEETDEGIKVTITDVTGPHSAIIKPGPKGDRGDPGVYVGPGEMPEDCYIQIDPTGEGIDVVTKKEFNELAEQVKSNENSVQPDWNQNDPEAPDYVKNRPMSSKTNECLEINGTFELYSGSDYYFSDGEINYINNIYNDMNNRSYFIKFNRDGQSYEFELDEWFCSYDYDNETYSIELMLEDNEDGSLKLTGIHIWIDGVDNIVISDISIYETIYNKIHDKYVNKTGIWVGGGSPLANIGIESRDFNYRIHDKIYYSHEYNCLFSGISENVGTITRSEYSPISNAIALGAEVNFPVPEQHRFLNDNKVNCYYISFIIDSIRGACILTKNYDSIADTATGIYVSPSSEVFTIIYKHPVGEDGTITVKRII